ncbi:hypothetical protein ZIOFF_069585 [Zingiber officinale]|uniref:Uncharacterized protein n=1 Tax=Zingiber officinale TaxID=94328 RepID=A0A8J5C628_ZINOF|nr:hypothetical protein ZIOFF_069585 [Zingiber officinale]
MSDDGWHGRDGDGRAKNQPTRWHGAREATTSGLREEDWMRKRVVSDDQASVVVVDVDARRSMTDQDDLTVVALHLPATRLGTQTAIALKMMTSLHANSLPASIFFRNLANNMLTGLVPDLSGMDILYYV